jgi:predicted DCC family thiol-disulfide oxidoreductase YuxK
MNESKSIILFDGVCHFCNDTVNFVIRRDSKEQFVFAALQSDVAQELLKKYDLSTGQLDSLVLIENEQCYLRSTAALRIVKGLGSLWTLLYVFIIIPTSMRDYGYDAFAKRRYRWFGKNDTCMIPTEKMKKRFL